MFLHISTSYCILAMPPIKAVEGRLILCLCSIFQCGNTKYRYLKHHAIQVLLNVLFFTNFNGLAVFRPCNIQQIHHNSTSVAVIQIFEYHGKIKWGLITIIIKLLMCNKIACKTFIFNFLKTFLTSFIGIGFRPSDSQTEIVNCDLDMVLVKSDV